MRIKHYLKKIPYLGDLNLCAKKHKSGVYLVGGFLRDAYLERKDKFYDFDFCVESKAHDFAKKFNSKVKGTLITLDEKQKSFRVIVKKDLNIYTFDFTQIRAKTLKDDLYLRDFTINTLLLDIKSIDKPFLIDLVSARNDLDKKVIKVCQPRVVADDPLRILRAFSFSVNLGFKIESKTLKLIIKHKKLLNAVSGERLNEELFKIFAADSSFAAIKKMSDYKIIDEVIPHIKEQRGVTQGTYHHLNVWEHSLDALLRFEILCKRKFLKNKVLKNYLNEQVANNHSRIQVLKLACLLHDCGKPKAKKQKNKRTIFYEHEKIGAEFVEDVYQKLKLSSKEKDFLKKLIFWHLRPGFLADQIKPSARATYRFFRDSDEEGAAIIILSLADWRATRGPEIDMKKRRRHERIMFSLIDHCFEEKKKKPKVKILSGYDLMNKFDIKPSKLIGEILKTIDEEKALGKVKTKKDAYSLVEKIIKRNHADNP